MKPLQHKRAFLTEFVFLKVILVILNSVSRTKDLLARRLSLFSNCSLIPKFFLRKNASLFEIFNFPLKVVNHDIKKFVKSTQNKNTHKTSSS